jgi:hypothetical protein
MFIVIRAVLLKPLAYRNPDQVVHLGGATIAHFKEMKEAQQSYSLDLALPLN